MDFKQAFRHFVSILKNMDVIDGKTIAIESFKIRAQNASKNNFNQKKIQRHIDYIDNKIDQYQQELDRQDQQDDDAQDKDKQKELKDKIDYQNTKKTIKAELNSKICLYM